VVVGRADLDHVATDRDVDRGVTTRSRTISTTRSMTPASKGTPATATS
jgi:hypothetical protein